MDAHIKNVEASTADGKFDPGAGLVKVKLIKCHHEKCLSLLSGQALMTLTINTPPPCGVSSYNNILLKTLIIFTTKIT